MDFEYSAWVPSLKKDIFIKEITTHQQKEIIKSISSPYTFEFVKTLDTLLKENISSRIKLGNLNLVDKLAILLKMRSQSIGSSVSYSFKCDHCEKNISTKVPLIPIVNKLNKLNLKNTKIKCDQLIITLGIPTISNEILLEKESYLSMNLEKAQFEDLFLRDVIIYLKSIKLLKTNILVDKMTIKNRLKCIEKIPVKVLVEIRAKIKELKEHLNEVTIIDVECLCGHKPITFKLNVDNSSYLQFVKSIFDENLHNVYQQIYYMTNILHFTPDYIEKMVPCERDIYWGYHARDSREKQSRQEIDIPVDNLESPLK